MAFSRESRCGTQECAMPQAFPGPVYVHNPANLSLFFGTAAIDEFFKSGADASEASDQQQEILRSKVGILPAKEFQQPNGAAQSFTNGWTVDGIRVEGDGRRERHHVTRRDPRLMKLALEIALSDLHIAKGHVGIAMAQQLHQR